MGLAISFVILAITFGSLLAAGMPILTSLMGVGVTLSAVVLVASRVTVSSSSPTLAEMLGLAVGIDYALFLLSRYRGQLSQGLPVAEAMSRALATAGSAVVFAGTTVVIALVGLTVAGIPVLTVMGLAAAAAVTVAVLIALTLLPAIALLLGERLRPKPRRQAPRAHSKPAAEPPSGAASRAAGCTPSRSGRWSPSSAVIAVLGCSRPPRPGTSTSRCPTTAPPRPRRPSGRPTTRSPRRSAPGYNSPLAVTADVITSTDPDEHRRQAGRRRQEGPRRGGGHAGDARTRAATPRWSSWSRRPGQTAAVDGRAGPARCAPAARAGRRSTTCTTSW